MTELTAEEQRIIKAYRDRTSRRHGRWIKELREAGYMIQPPVAVVAATDPEPPARPELTETQELLRSALEGLGRAAMASEIRRAAEETLGRKIPFGSVGTALRYLVIKGYVSREEAHYSLT